MDQSLEAQKYIFFDFGYCFDRKIVYFCRVKSELSKKDRKLLEDKTHIIAFSLFFGF